MKKGGFSLFLAFTTQGPLGVRVKEMGEMGKGGSGNKKKLQLSAVVATTVRKTNFQKGNNRNGRIWWE